jgi:predicted DNA-binding transcriptional regulator AlpA
MFGTATSSTPATHEGMRVRSATTRLSDREPPLEDDRALPTLLRPNDVVRLFAVSRAWVYEAARTGRIPSVRLGGEAGPLRFVASDLEQWLAEARACRRLGGSGHTAPAESEPPRSVVPVDGQQSLL